MLSGFTLYSVNFNIIVYYVTQEYVFVHNPNLNKLDNSHDFKIIIYNPLAC